VKISRRNMSYIYGSAIVYHIKIPVFLAQNRSIVGSLHTQDEWLYGPVDSYRAYPTWALIDQSAETDPHIEAEEHRPVIEHCPKLSWS
jgi:hypothetical protein